MSLPSFPKVDPPIERENAVNQILSSIAMEELGLSHILDAEGEKLQYVLGTLPGLSGPSATVGDVLATTESVRSMLETAVQNQLFLKAKMQGALPALPEVLLAQPVLPAPPVPPVPWEPPALPARRVPRALPVLLVLPVPLALPVLPAPLAPLALPVLPSPPPPHMLPIPAAPLCG